MSQFTEQDLIAFHLNELSPRRAEQLRSALAADPHLAAESRAIAATLAAIEIPGEPHAISDSDYHWGRLRPALAAASTGGGPRSWWRPFSLGIACGALLPVFLLLHRASPVAYTPAPVFPQSAVLDRSVVAGPPAGAAPASGQTRSGMQVAWRNEPLTCPAPRLETASLTPAVPAVPGVQSPTLAFPLLASQASSTTASAGVAAVSQSSTVQSETATIATVGVASPSILPEPRPRSYFLRSPVSITVAALGNLTSGWSSVSTQNSVLDYSYTAQAATLNGSPAAGILVGMEKAISPRVAVRLDAAMHPSTLSYTSGTYAVDKSGVIAQFAAGNIRARQIELLPSAVVQLPAVGRLSPYVQAGGGLEIFAPKDNPNLNVHRAFSGAGMVGAGVTVPLTGHLSLTAGYRGVLYRTPAYRYSFAVPVQSGGTVPVYDRPVLFSQPVAGITYTFGKGRED